MRSLPHVQQNCMAKIKRKRAVQGIAIVSMACRFPGANNTAELWRNLRDGVESISFFSDEQLAAAGVPTSTLRDPKYVKAKPVIDDVELFDGQFFGLSPKESDILDPQHRLFLECAWEALELASYNADNDKLRIGVFGGTSISTYLMNNLRDELALIKTGSGLEIILSNTSDYLTTMVSHKLNLNGPSISLNTACSTSLVAVCLASQSLLDEDCDMALAGGVSVTLPRIEGYFHQDGGIFSPDGHCRAFDADARGTIFGNGVGIVVLKRLEDAVRDGDRIRAVIRGHAVNNDGASKEGFTAPSVEGQIDVVRMALSVAGISARTIKYVEAHGTATQLGDPIEVEALTKAFAPDTKARNFCALGSIKTNVGHLNAASGVAGLIKTVLAVEHKAIPPTLHFKRPNPHIDFSASPFCVNTKLIRWPRGSAPRRAGVSSFGIGGTNAHVIIEEAPRQSGSSDSGSWQLLPLSAKTETALENMTANLAEHLVKDSRSRIGDVAYTLQVGRKAFRHRRVIVCRNRADVSAALKSENRGVLTGTVNNGSGPTIFMFPGQGSQSGSMGLQLYKTFRAFRDVVDECATLLKSDSDIDLNFTTSSQSGNRNFRRDVDETAITQPALFVIEYALARFWMQLGVSPQAMIGHSLGEYVSACLAGVLSLRDALALVAVRGKLIQSLPRGAMLAAALSENDARTLLGKDLDLAAVNGSSISVFAGPRIPIDELRKRLAQRGVPCQLLKTSHAFHSSMIEPVVESFVGHVKRVTLHPPLIPFISNVTGDWITREQTTDPQYWAAHLQHTVQFYRGLSQCLGKPDCILLEVGPGQTVSGLAKKHPLRTSQQLILSSLPHQRDQRSEEEFFLQAVGKLWLRGEPIDWPVLSVDKRRHRIELPTYPFERRRHWIEPGGNIANTAVSQTAKGKKLEFQKWFYRPVWKDSAVPVAEQSTERKCILVFADSCGLASELIKHLARANHDVVSVRIGKSFAKSADAEYRINPKFPKDYDALFKKIWQSGKIPNLILHMWGITKDTAAPAINTSLDRTLLLGFYSLIYIAQALGKRELQNSLHMDIFTNDTYKIGGETVVCPEKTTVLGPIEVIPHEYRKVSCRNIDIELTQIQKPQLDRLVNKLLLECRDPSTDRIVAYRGSRRLVQDFERLAIKEESTGFDACIRDNGVYLITGGLGGMGLALADYLAKTKKVKLILTGRSPFPLRGKWQQWLQTHDASDATTDRINRLMRLEQAGAQIMIARADVSDYGRMHRLIQRARRRFVAINGVIHAAGVSEGSVIQTMNRNLGEKMLSAKVRGTLVLERILGHTGLDFFVLCSSTSSIAPPFGLTGYAAANAFLDAFANYKHPKDQSLTVSINWDTWDEVGMAVREMERQFAPQAPLGRLERLDHPLLHSCERPTAHQAIYVSRLSAVLDWVLNEHRVMGAAVLPGTAYLEMAAAAFRHHYKYKRDRFQMRDVFFLRPLVVQDGAEREVQTILTDRSRKIEFTVRSRLESRSDDWEIHCKGLLYPSPRETFARRKLKNFGTALTANTSVDAKGVFASDLLKLGQRWDNLRRVKFWDHQGVAQLELPDALKEETESYRLHPALLDNATGFLAWHFQSLGTYAPFSYKQIDVTGPLPPSIYSHAQVISDSQSSKDSLKFDIVIADKEEREIVRIKEYSLRKIALNEQQPTKSEAKKNVQRTEENFILEISAPGNLSSLKSRQSTRPAPSPGEVEIQVRAVGLNFKDVLTALGVVPDPSLQLGLECAGSIVRVGEGVGEFKKGDEVFGFAPAAFRAFVNSPASMIARKPETMTPEDAAGLPLAYMTAYYALLKQARLARHESVLIHAAASGVGLAAVKIAQWIGAEIYATAGNEEKRAYLHSLGIKHVFDSRSLGFADGVRNGTAGRGVDVVLNSLAGEFIPKSLSVLAPHGRFVEIGMRDIILNKNLNLQPFIKGLSFFSLLIRPELPDFGSTWAELVRYFNDGVFGPLPNRMFGIARVREAFHFMSQAKHIGKIVVSVTDPDEFKTLSGPSEADRQLPPSPGLLPSLEKDERSLQTIDEFRRKISAESISPAEGIKAFRLALGYDLPQIVISTLDLNERIKDRFSRGLRYRETLKSLGLHREAHPRPEITSDYIAPRDQTEERIAKVMRELLGVDKVGLHDDFLELGGNSLQAIEGVTRLREIFGVELPMGSFIEKPTLALLAERIKHMQNGKNISL